MAQGALGEGGSVPVWSSLNIIIVRSSSWDNEAVWCSYLCSRHNQLFFPAALESLQSLASLDFSPLSHSACLIKTCWAGVINYLPMIIMMTKMMKEGSHLGGRNMPQKTDLCHRMCWQRMGNCSDSSHSQTQMPLNQSQELLLSCTGALKTLKSTHGLIANTGSCSQAL